MAVLFVLSIAGIFHRALHLHSSKHKWGFCCENSTTTSATSFSSMGNTEVCPIASNISERCIYIILTTKKSKVVEIHFDNDNINKKTF